MYETFKSKIDEKLNTAISTPTGCLIRTSNFTREGYPVVTVYGKVYTLHRLVYWIYNDNFNYDDFSKGVYHRCDVRACINPNHLFHGVQADNMRDMVSKGRARNDQMLKTHCLRGHEFNTGNTLTYKSFRTGMIRRICRVCARKNHGNIS